MDQTIDKKIYLIDSDISLRSYLNEKLSQNSFIVTEFENGIDALESISKNIPDLVVMELDLPVLSGITIVQETQKIDSNIHIIVLTGNYSSDLLVNAFNLGIDDFMTKPFVFEELLARIRARLGFTENEKKMFSYKDIIVDTYKKRIYKNGKKLQLSHKEYQLLLFLIQNKNKVYSRDALLENVWGMEKFIVSRSVDVYVGRLRKKLEGNGVNYIKTRRGFGYLISD